MYFFRNIHIQYPQECIICKLRISRSTTFSLSLHVSAANVNARIVKYNQFAYSIHMSRLQVNSYSVNMSTVQVKIRRDCTINLPIVYSSLGWARTKNEIKFTNQERILNSYEQLLLVRKEKPTGIPYGQYMVLYDKNNKIALPI